MDLSDIASKLQRFVVSNQQEDRPAVEDIRVPRGHEIVNRVSDPIQDRIDRYLAGPIPDIQVDPRFANVPDITENLQAVSYDFKDSKHIEDQSVLLMRLDDDEVAELGRKIIPIIPISIGRADVALHPS